MNIYRGCSHGCIYCDSRSKCYQMDHKFEDIEIKTDAPQILFNQLLKKKKPCMIATGAMTDPYLPLEKDILYTRQCLEIISRLGFGITLLTKSNLILRDLDLLKSINEKAKSIVQMTLTTFDEKLCKIIEPNVCTTKERFEALKIFNQNNIDTIVWLTPILPFINDSEENLVGILDYCKQANVKGIINFGFGVTLRDGDREYFYNALDKYFPSIKNNYIKSYGLSYELLSCNNEKLQNIFNKFCKENNIMYKIDEIFKFINTLPEKEKQLTLF